ncbi:MAG: GldG family protein [Vicinamibacterales bacterium]
MGTRIFNIISWIGIALVMGAVGISFGMPAQEQYATYLAWAGLACVGVYILSQWREILTFFGGRSARYGTLAASSVLIVLGILVALNYIGKKQNKRWDLTESSQFSLSDQSRNIVSKLEAPLHVMVFAQETQFRTFRDRLQEYQYASKQITTEYVDPDKKPMVAQQNNVQQYGTIVFQYQGRTERVTNNTEQDITNTIIKVVTGTPRKVYFTTGHGERDTGSGERDGYQVIYQALTDENYGVDKLVIAQTAAVPDDASVVVIAGPKTDFLAPEIEALKTYLGKGGKILLLLDPKESADSPALSNLIAFGHEWGIDATDTIVVDGSGMGRLFGADASVPIAANYPSHPITERFSVLTAYPLARALVAVQGGVDGHTASPFVESGPRSWAESDIRGMLSSGEVSLDEAKGDRPGPVTIAAAVAVRVNPPELKPEGLDVKADSDVESRLAIFGDSDFVSNGVIGIQGNKDMFLNTVGWLSQQENLISIRAREASDRRLTLTATQQNNITWLSLLIVPGVVFGAGIYSWWRRR